MTEPLEFPNETAAWKWMRGLDLEFMDNRRLAYAGDYSGLRRYVQQQRNGCCGFLDRRIIIAGRPAVIGCNYGH